MGDILEQLDEGNKQTQPVGEHYESSQERADRRGDDKAPSGGAALRSAAVSLFSEPQ